jgi:alpha-tubulin suppressor-like RCC1 family protein
LAVDASGTLWGWGDNSTGKLDDIGSGDRLDAWTGPYQTTPIKLMEGVAAASGGTYTLALKTDGTLWRRGQGEGWSQLLDGVTAMAQGGGNYAAIRKDGSLWLWGDNRFGQLSPGGVEEDYAEAPVKVMDGVKTVSLNGHIMAVKNDDTLWSWGAGNYGTLGSGQVGEEQREGLACRGEPVQILDHVAKVATSWNNAFAVKTDGTLWAWGLNAYGELGDADLHHIADAYGQYIQTVPAQVMAEVADVAAGHGTTYIIKTDGTLWACGANQFGEAGVGSSGGSVTEPVQILDQVAHVSAGDCVGYAVRNDGTLWSWGTNGTGELGYFGGDGWDVIGPQQTNPRQVLFLDGMPAPRETEVSVTPDVMQIYIDGEPVAFPVLMSYDGQGGGTIYVRLRDLAYALSGTRSGFNVVFDDLTGISSLLIGVYVPVGGEMVPPILDTQTAKVSRSTFGSSRTSGAEYYHTLSVTGARGDSYTYVRLRDLAPSHFFNVIWNGRQVVIETGTWYTWGECSF